MSGGASSQHYQTVPQISPSVNMVQKRFELVDARLWVRQSHIAAGCDVADGLVAVLKVPRRFKRLVSGHRASSRLNNRLGSNYILGVECDGATYHSSKSARDRDRIRQHVLEGLNWKIHRVWSTDWYRNPEREFRRLVQKIEKLRA